MEQNCKQLRNNLATEQASHQQTALSLQQSQARVTALEQEIARKEDHVELTDAESRTIVKEKVTTEVC